MNTWFGVREGGPQPPSARGPGRGVRVVCKPRNGPRAPPPLARAQTPAMGGRASKAQKNDRLCNVVDQTYERDGKKVRGRADAGEGGRAREGHGGRGNARARARRERDGGGRGGARECGCQASLPPTRRTDLGAITQHSIRCSAGSTKRESRWMPRRTGPGRTRTSTDTTLTPTQFVTTHRSLACRLSLGALAH